MFSFSHFLYVFSSGIPFPDNTFVCTGVSAGQKTKKEKDMHIIAKTSSLRNAQGTAKDGAASFEFQIIDEHPIDYDEIDDITALRPITSVHTLLRKDTDICLEDLAVSELAAREFLKALKLADRLSKDRGRSTKLILHAKTTEVTEEAAILIESAMKQFDVTLLVENTCRGPNDPTGNALPASAPAIAGKLRKMCPGIDPERFGTVLDTCHAMLTLRKHTPENEYCLEDYFRAHGSDCRIIHFANSRMPDEGLNHGCGFDTAEERALARMLYDMARKYTPNADIVVEMAEADYTDAVNFRGALALLRGFEDENADTDL